MRRQRLVQLSIVVILIVLAIWASVTLQTSTNKTQTTIQLSTASVSGYSQSGYANSTQGFLVANGTQIVDGNGDIVILRGVNLSGYEYIPPIQWIHNQTDYATIAAFGFNAVRLQISWENLQPRPHYYNDSYLEDLVDHDISWARQYGIYIVLDMHQICWSSHFRSCNGLYSAGFPNWAVSSYPDNNQGMQQMIHDFYIGLGPNGTQPASSNPSLQSLFFAAWQHVASRYRNEQIIAAYDVLNEPSQQYKNVDANFTHIVLPSFYLDAINAIRQVDPHHLCLWEEPTEGPIQLPNTAYSPHYPQISTSYYNGLRSLTLAMEQIVNSSKAWNVPVFVGEWGMKSDAPGVAQYIADSLSLYDTYSIGSAWWTYARGNYTLDLFDAHGTPRQILVQNLVRPYVRQTSSIILTSTLSVQNASYIRSLTIQGGDRTLQVLISVPSGFTVTRIQTDGGPCVSCSSIEDGTLHITLPARASAYEITLEYEGSFL